MNIDDFKSVYASKTPAEKLDLLMVQVDFYGDAKMNYAEAYYGRRNDKDAVYYRDEAIAMIERIKWLRDEIKSAIWSGESCKPKYELLPKCGYCGKAIDDCWIVCPVCGKKVEW